MSGSAVGFCGRPRYFTSPTTPTIDIQGLLDVSEPNFTRLPIGSCPGQNRLTTASLTIATCDVAEISASLNVRPLTTGMRSVLKKSGVTRCTYIRGTFCALTAGWPSAA